MTNVIREITKFPTDFTAAASTAKDLVNIVWGGKPADNVQAIALDLYNLVGFAVGQAVGNPVAVIGAAAPEESATADLSSIDTLPLEACKSQLETIASFVQSDGKQVDVMRATSDALPDVLKKIDWLSLASTLLKVILPLILKK